jgi:hypothetical protein
VKFSALRRAVQISTQTVQGRTGRNAVSAEQPGRQAWQRRKAGRARRQSEMSRQIGQCPQAGQSRQAGSADEGSRHGTSGREAGRQAVQIRQAGRIDQEGRQGRSGSQEGRTEQASRKEIIQAAHSGRQPGQSRHARI